MMMAPPLPPGPGLAWIDYGCFVDQQVAAALAWLDATIAEQEPPEFRAHLLRQRPHIAARVEGLVRLHYEREAKH
jgi:hypothetical protein